MSTAKLNLVDAHLMTARESAAVPGLAQARALLAEAAQVLRSTLLPVSGSVARLTLDTRYEIGTD